MEATDKGNDFMRAALVERAEFARQLDRAFIGLGAGVRKEHLVEATVCDQRIGEFQAGSVEEGRARGQQYFRLRGEGVGDHSG